MSCLPDVTSRGFIDTPLSSEGIEVVLNGLEVNSNLSPSE